MNTTSDLRSQSCVIRFDLAAGFQALRDNTSLHPHGITLDFGYVKNKNSNCVVDKSIQDLELKRLKLSPSAGAITSTQLHLAIHALNSLICNRDLSTKEILCQLDQVTHEQLNLKDVNLSTKQEEQT